MAKKTKLSSAVSSEAKAIDDGTYRIMSDTSEKLENILSQHSALLGKQVRAVAVNEPGIHQVYKLVWAENNG